MLYTLENDRVRVQLDDLGGQLVSMVEKSTGTEYIWQADPAYWTGKAPLMFPICGRLTEGRYTYRGKSYEMLSHGFLRRMPLSVSAQTENSISFTLCNNEETLSQYPFAFRFTVTYTLDGMTLHHHFKVENTGDDVLPFALGGHPGFNVPLQSGTEFTDYYVEFSEACAPLRFIQSETCYMTDELQPWPLEDGRIYRLHHGMFDHDAVFMRDMASTITLKSDKTTKSVTLSYEGMPYLGLWHAPKKEAPYICIEPWNGMPADDGVVDDMATKKYMNRIVPGEIFTCDISITVHA